MKYENITSRIGVRDKREIFQKLLAMTERLFFLNKFPVDMQDFALSFHEPEAEASWRFLWNMDKSVLSPTDTVSFHLGDKENSTEHFFLHVYPDAINQGSRRYSQYAASRIFMDVSGIPSLEEARRHNDIVRDWAKKQLRLEDQMLRAAGVLKSIVRNCNTVGQYREVSSDLITFLPDKYKQALKEYTKRSPYPDINVEPEEIDTMLATLAYAALQPTHSSETNYTERPGYWRDMYYQLAVFPRTTSYTNRAVRQLDL